ncbi:hypothetical protein B0I35DRAFT_426252 [Stachybotrys elegans]|uniref:Uncharacterized protein n=1 Tax=Stachybotrys elegans TaxID=80388 RepID=A0A8K0SVG0_9HYPO|nr:hypothetical protein B0I35DRAFT_426252 [Stachybotrys elegans]
MRPTAVFTALLVAAEIQAAPLWTPVRSELTLHRNFENLAATLERRAVVVRGEGEEEEEGEMKAKNDFCKIFFFFCFKWW